MDISQTLSNIGRGVSEARMPHIWNWTQRRMPTYTDAALAFQWLWVAPRVEWFAQLGGWTAAPVLLVPNAIDTVVNWLPNVYNWAADEYNAWADMRAYNNYMANVDEDTKRKIQRRGMGQIGWTPNTQTSLTWRRIGIDMAPVLPQAPAVTEVAVPQPDTYIMNDWQIVAKEIKPPVYQYSTNMPSDKRVESKKAKSLIANALKAMKKSGQLTAQPTVAKSLINLYKKLK